MSSQPCGCDPEIQYTSQQCKNLGRCISSVGGINRSVIIGRSSRGHWPNESTSIPSGEHSFLPSDPTERKKYPIATGVLDYFPDAIAAVAYVSYIGNEQHNPGQPLHWAREKSTDQSDTMMRHYLERGTFDKDGCRHTAKMVWRALAQLQLEIEAERT